MRDVCRAFSLLLLLATIVAPAPAIAQCDAPIDLGRGPVNFYVPDSYDPDEPAPLVVLLHGRGGAGSLQERYMGFRPMADRFGFLYAYPDGTRDISGVLFWNGTDACCDYGGTGVDDSGYLLELVETIEAQCNVDPRKIYFTGHSNGGFMSYRMACDHARRIAAIAPLAGATYYDPADCRPRRPVHVLHVHGTRDETIFYDGGGLGGVLYPGAVASVETWADYNGCRAEGAAAPAGLDLDEELEGRETHRMRFTRACSAGGSAELWTIEDGGHVPALSSNYARAISEFLLAHPKPGQCSGSERVVAKRCTRSGKLILKLRAGLARDGYRVELENGEYLYGVLNRKGRAKVRFKGLPDGDGTARITFGCGEVEVVPFECG